MFVSRRVTRALLLGIPSLAVALAAASLFIAAPAHGETRRSCPPPDLRKSPEQMLRQHVALLGSGQVDAAVCDYAEDASVILPGQVVRGREAISSALSGFASLLGGAPPEISTITASGPIVLLTFEDLGSPCQIPDGADTYVVVLGRIVAQTVHDALRSAPGAVCPAAP
jgi:hypothetical protein